MVLNNYYKLQGYFSSHYNSESAMPYPTINTGAITVSGETTPDMAYSAANTYVHRNYAIRDYLYLLVGTDDTLPEKDDYSLGTDVTSSFSNYTCTFNVTSEPSGKVSVKVVASGINNTGSTITIKEAGIRKRYAKIRGGYFIDDPDTNGYDILLTRDVLNSPIVVPSGESLSITYEWDEN